MSLRPFWGDLVIKYTRVGFDRTDIVTEGDAKNMARQAEYKDREAHTEIKHTSSFGTCTVRFKVYKVSSENFKAHARRLLGLYSICL